MGPGRRRPTVKNHSVVVLGILLSTGLNPHVGPETWKTFTSPDGGFSILMPGTPTLTQHHRDSVVGTIRENTYALKTSSGEYSVEYTDLPGMAVSLGGKGTILEKAKEGLLKEEGATESSFTLIQLGTGVAPVWWRVKS
jgi:hypothetical protein